MPHPRRSGLSFAAGETDGPWYAIYAVLFGVGFGLAIDEYALWLRLDDVYWSHEGRSSIDAALIALGLIGFVLLAFVPTRIGDDSFARWPSRWSRRCGTSPWC